MSYVIIDRFLHQDFMMEDALLIRKVYGPYDSKAEAEAHNKQGFPHPEHNLIVALTFPSLHAVQLDNGQA